jgi:hypothetical protein
VPSHDGTKAPRSTNEVTKHFAKEKP